jgi:hypothetical protein
MELLPDRFMPELHQLRAELNTSHSYREPARLLAMLLPSEPLNNATMRNRTHRVAAEIENQVAAPQKIDAEPILGLI